MVRVSKDDASSNVVRNRRTSTLSSLSSRKALTVKDISAAICILFLFPTFYCLFKMLLFEPVVLECSATSKTGKAQNIEF